MIDNINLPPEFISMNDIPASVALIKRGRMEEILRDAIEADRQQRGEPVACPSCGTHEVSLERTCHNSSCCDYGKDVTVHEGWKDTPPPAPTEREPCKTCGGTKVDPGGSPICRTCGRQHTTPAQEPSDELEMFETWFLESNPSWEITPQEKRSGTYVFERANIQWVAWQARALLARYGAAQPAASAEHNYAEQEGKRNAAADGYFKVRARLMDTAHNRRVFEAGFDRGYEAAPTPPSATTFPICQVKQFSDQMVCDACKLKWDANDIDPPRCVRPAYEG